MAIEPMLRFSGRPFSAARLTGSPVIDAPEPLSAALRSVISETDGPEPLPTRGWRLLYLGEPDAEFAAWDDAWGGWVSLRLRNEAGGWHYAGSSYGVTPRVVREGAGNTDWCLDPAFSAPVPSSATLHVLVTELACTGGRSSEDRVLPAEVEYGHQDVTIAFFVTPLPPGIYTCPSNPPTRITVDLREPLGRRDLLDGGVYPPRSVLGGRLDG